MMKKILIGSVLACTSFVVLAKLPVPAPTPESIAKADEAKAKAAEVAKKDAELLGKSQDKVADHWAAKLKAQGKEFKPTPIAAPAPAAAAPAAPGAAPAVAASAVVPSAAAANAPKK